jgi:subtilisin family serine protease
MKKLIFVLCCLFLAIPCIARTITIDDNDPADFNDFQDAINDTNYGDIIVPKPSTYHGNDRYLNLHQAEYVPNEIIIKFHETVAKTVETQLELKTPAKELTLSKSLDKLNATYKVIEIKPMFKNFRARCQQIKTLWGKDSSLLSNKEKHILRRLKRAAKDAQVPDLDRIYKIQVELKSDQSLEEVVAAYSSNPDVEYTELNYIVSIDWTPNDPYYPVQWPLNNIGQIYPESGNYNHPPGTPDCDIDAPEAWDINTGSPEVIVAVADTGVDYTHRDIDDNMWTDPNGYHGYDFVNLDNYPLDDHGHGTHCAGIIAGEGNNGLDIVGVCWNVKIMALKFLNASGSGTYENAANAFYYGVNNGADVISNSWSKSEYSQTMQDAIDYAYSQGVVIVGSAGNDNSSSPRYPANNEHVISVAATNSNDEKASFSNYGSWIDIAAPGVDVLSLRAAGSSAGTPYDTYTTIMSGTSMSCPMVSAACAMLFSKQPSLTVNEVSDILLVKSDPIPSGICNSNGRLNIQKAIKTVNFDRNYYTCSDEPVIKLIDFDLEGEPNVAVTIETSEGDYETIILEVTSQPWLFDGKLTTEIGAPVVGDKILQISHGQIITVTYEDADDGTGNPSIEFDSAVIDCQEPIISNVQIEMVTCMAAVITFDTDEPSVSKIKCGLDCNGPYTIIGEDPKLITNHWVPLENLESQINYYFVIEANDIAGNLTTDNNNGSCYQLSTTETPIILRVPYDYSTIQEAIDAAVDCSIITVADGIYTGPGNRDIDFRGKIITVKSENGPINCTIDCQGSASDAHRAFHFNNYEDRNTILDGFTIINGYTDGKGGGIKCYIGSPTIQNCIISNNHAGKRTQYHCGGAGIHILYSNPQIINCIVSDNYGYNHGGIYIESGNVDIINCVIERNEADYVSDIMGTFSYGGGICSQSSNILIKNCIIANNWSYRLSGGIDLNRGSANIVNCTIVNNTAGDKYGGVSRINESNVNITNSIIWGNQAPQYPQLDNGIIASYGDIEGGYLGIGNINSNPSLADEMGYDFHLKSQAGRWDPVSQTWVTDSVTSPGIDAGDPNSDWTAELWPNGKRINMGAYGGTPQASMSLSTVGNIADFNNDGIVDYNDLRLYTEQWLNQEVLLPQNLDRNGAVNLIDYAIFADNWLWQ